MSNIKTVCDNHFKNVRFDVALIKRLQSLQYSLYAKDEDTLAFFGDGLWGTHPIYFNNADISILFDDVFNIDDIGLKSDLHELPSINPSFKVRSDVIGHSLFYITHRALTDKSISNKDQDRIIRYSLYILHFRYLSSLQGHYFKYPIDRQAAMTVYSGLSKRYSIKTAGSWGKLVEERVANIVDTRGLHYRTLIKYTDDEQILYLLTDSQGRIRDVCKKITKEFYRIKDEGEFSGVQSKMLSGDDGTRIADTTNAFTIYRSYLDDIIADRSTLIRSELTTIIVRTVPRIPEKDFIESIKWLSDNYHTSHNKKIMTWLDDVIGHALEQIVANRLRTNQLAEILAKLRNLYVASRVRDDILVSIKERAGDFINRATGKSNENSIAVIRQGLLLYIILRVLVKDSI